MTARSTTLLRATAFVAATLAATCLLVAAGLGEEAPAADAKVSAVLTQHASPRATP